FSDSHFLKPFLETLFLKHGSENRISAISRGARGPTRVARPEHSRVYLQVFVMNNLKPFVPGSASHESFQSSPDRRDDDRRTRNATGRTGERDGSASCRIHPRPLVAS